MPTSSELNSLATQIQAISVGKGTNGLMLCDTQENSPSARCSHGEFCKGVNTWCDPGLIWSSDISGTAAYRYYLGNSELLGPQLSAIADVFSFRCIAEL